MSSDSVKPNAKLGKGSAARISRRELARLERDVSAQIDSVYRRLIARRPQLEREARALGMNLVWTSNYQET